MSLFKRKNIEVDTKQETIEFDRDAWESFVRYVHNNNIKTDRANIGNKLFIKYNYLGIDYLYLIYRYNIRDGKILNIEFHVPDDKRSTLSCNLINRVNKVSNAINFVIELINGECAK